jgi:hypothetical protein
MISAVVIATLTLSHQLEYQSEQPRTCGSCAPRATDAQHSHCTWAITPSCTWHQQGEHHKPCSTCSLFTTVLLAQCHAIITAHAACTTPHQPHCCSASVVASAQHMHACGPSRSRVPAAFTACRTITSSIAPQLAGGQQRHSATCSS